MTVLAEALLDLQNKIISECPDIILMGYGGSHAYGTNIETSDIDIRGIYMNPADEFIGISIDKEQYCPSGSDTVIYSFKKILKLLYNCNPNVIELLGLREQDYMILSDYGKMLIDNRELFLSKKAVYTFGNYAKSQLNRLINKSGRYASNIIENECRSLDKAFSSFRRRYDPYLESGSDISVSNKNNNIYLSMNIKDLPVNTVAAMLNEISSINKDYNDSSRNSKAIAHDKLNKHMMHLLRLYMMGIDILEKHEIITYRSEEHDLLMAIRNYEFLESDKITPTKDFEKLLNEYQTRFEKAAETTSLPDVPDTDKINKLVMDIVRSHINTNA